MSFVDKLIGTLAPHECLGCGFEGSLLCPACVELLNPVPERCFRCHKTSPLSLTCKPCRQVSRLHQVHVCTDYDYVAKELVRRLKFTGAQAAATIMAGQMATFIDKESKTLIVPVPTATSRVRQRGYDQAKLLARHIARHCGLAYFDCLARSGQSHQVGASRTQRLKQLETTFRSKSLDIPAEVHVTLIDDVVTTGATLQAASKALKAAGAQHVDAIVFAQP